MTTLPADITFGPIRLAVADLARSVVFYQDVLGLQVHAQDAQLALLGCATPLLALVGSIYLPYLVGNAQAMLRGEQLLAMPLAGHTWRGQASPYKRCCLTWLRRSLAALLGAAGPVCAGINLEYYFSYVDNERYGSGTKLPHNVTGLLGVMNGQSSDLRTGLPWQMVEVHEPVRLLLIVESTPEKMLQAAFQSPVVRELIENRWIRVVTIDPHDGAFHVYRNSVFEPFTTKLEELPTVASSPAWFLGKLDHLPVVRVAGQSAG